MGALEGIQDGDAHDFSNRELDLAALKGLAHPLRAQLLDALSIYGPATASMLAERLGESSGATSYHLRQLAKHDFIHEVKDRGSARERWWERTRSNISLPHVNSGTDPVTQAATRLIDREWEHARRRLLDEFISRGPDVLSVEWTDASEIVTADAYMTRDELREVWDAWNEHVLPIIVKRIRTINPPGSRPVQIHFNMFPILDGKEVPP